MKRNVSLLLGTIIGILAALSFMQTHSSDSREMLHRLNLPLSVKQQLTKLPKDDRGVGSYILELPDKSASHDRKARIRDKCF